jgi:hypothetical protein
LFGFLKKVLGDPAAINDYFCDASLVYACGIDKVAGVAALTAAKVAASVQRESMVNYAVGIASDLRTENPTASNNLLTLCQAIQEKDWAMRDITTAKSELRALDKDMAIALDKSDGQYFRRVFPDFFKDF